MVHAKGGISYIPWSLWFTSFRLGGHVNMGCNLRRCNEVTLADLYTEFSLPVCGVYLPQLSKLGVHFPALSPFFHSSISCIDHDDLVLFVNHLLAAARRLLPEEEKEEKRRRKDWAARIKRTKNNMYHCQCNWCELYQLLYIWLTSLWLTVFSHYMYMYLPQVRFFLSPLVYQSYKSKLGV